MKSSSSIRMALFLTASACLVASVLVEGTSRGVRGTVTDQNDNALDGAIVQIENSRSQEIRSFITQRDGAYRFYGLNPDIDYVLRARYHGFWGPARTLSAFDSRKEAVIHLKVMVKE